MNVRSILSDPAYPALRDFILNHTGLDYYASKDEDLAARLSRRLTALKMTSCSPYLALLSRPAAEPSELDALVGELTIGETYFFRQSEHFDLLRSTIFPDLLERNQSRRQLRIWSAGCATGAEPFSVAMLLQLEFAGRIDDWGIHILGTDINLDFLAQARLASFSKWALRDVPPELHDCCFQKLDNRWVLNDQFRRMVTFRYHNLANNSQHPDPDGLPFDLILCRNVMIYFSAGMVQSVAHRLFGELVDGGWLLPGHAEYSTETWARFDLVRVPEGSAYRKPSGGRLSASTPAVCLSADAFELIEFPLPAAPPAVQAVTPPALTTFAIPVTADYRESVEDARLLADRGRGDEAAAICRRLLRADSLDATAHFTLGLILDHQGELERAIEALRRAIYSDRDFALAYYHLGTLLQRYGDVPGSRRALHNAVDLLVKRVPDDPVDYGDGMTVNELIQLSRMHLELLER